MKWFLTFLTAVGLLSASAVEAALATDVTPSSPWFQVREYLLTQKTNATAKNLTVETNLTVGGDVRANNLISTNQFFVQRALAYSGTNVTLDATVGNVFNLTLTNNMKLFASNLQKGYKGWANLRQDGSGSRIFYFDSVNIKTNAATVLSTAANSRDILLFWADDTGTNLCIKLEKTFQ